MARIVIEVKIVEKVNKHQKYDLEAKEHYCFFLCGKIKLYFWQIKDVMGT